MNSQVVKSIGFASANMLYEIGNCFNLNSLFNISESSKAKTSKSDLRSLELDWNFVGSGVLSAVERYEREIARK